MFFLLYNVVSNVMRISVNIYVLVFILNCQQVCFYKGAFVCPTWTSATNLLIFVLWSTDCKDSVKYYYGKVLSLFFNNKSEKMLYELQVPRSGNYIMKPTASCEAAQLWVRATLPPHIVPRRGTDASTMMLRR